MTLLGGLFFVFIATSLVATFVNDSFDNSSIPENDIDNFVEGVNTRAHESELTAWRVFGDIIAMFFWSFGNLPAWLDLILFVPLRIVFFLTLIRNVWVGGGS